MQVSKTHKVLGFLDKRPIY